MSRSQCHGEFVGESSRDGGAVRLKVRDPMVDKRAGGVVRSKDDEDLRVREGV